MNAITTYHLDIEEKLIDLLLKYDYNESDNYEEFTIGDYKIKRGFGCVGYTIELYKKIEKSFLGYKYTGYDEIYYIDSDDYNRLNKLIRDVIDMKEKIKYDKVNKIEKEKLKKILL